jgi:hypothetical protein
MGTGMTEDLAISTLAGDYGTPAAAYSVRKVRTAYSGALMDVRRDYDNVTSSIGFVSNGDLDTGSLLDFVVAGRAVLPGAYSGLAAAYSLRKVSGSYTGSAIDVRRDSDNTTSSIGFNAAGNLDTGTLLAFVTGSANTGSGFVAQWYDQSGNARHATQTATGSQPLIVSSGSLITENSKPVIQFDLNSFIPTPIDGNTVLPLNAFATVKVDSYGGIGAWYLGFTGTDLGKYELAQGSTGISTIYRTGSTQTTLVTYSPANTTSLYLHAGLYDTSSLSTYVNSQVSESSKTIAEGPYYNPQNITIGSGRAALRGNFKYAELLLYTSSQSTNRSLIENNINNYYNIYTGSNQGFVARWYDQSGNNRHATQTATGSQPLIVKSGSVLIINNKPAPKWSDSLLVSNLQGITRLDSYYVQQTNDTKYTYPEGNNPYGSYGMFVQSGSNSTDLNNSYGTPTYFINGSQFSGTTQNQLFTSISSSQRIVLHQNASTINFGSTFRIAMAPFIGTTDFNYSGSFQEMVFYSGDQSANREAIHYGINNYYNIYPQTSSFATSSFTIQAGPTSVSASLNNRLTSGISTSGPLGLITVSRTGSNSLTIARNGVTSSFAVPASGALSTGIYLGAINNNGLALGNSPLNIEYASVGTGLTNTEISNYTPLVYNLRNNFKGYDRDAVTFINALGTAKSYLTSTQQSAINVLVSDLKSTNLWDKFQVMYPLIGGTAASHGFNLKDPRPIPAAYYMTFTGGTHNATGYSQNGNSGLYGLTNFNPAVNLINVSSSHISLYVPILNTQDGYDFGTANAGTFGIALRTPWGQMAVGLGGVSAAISPPAHGYFIGSRIGTTTVMTRYSGSTVVSGSGTGTAYNYPNFNAQLGSQGYGATSRFYSFLTIGSGLTLDERNQLNSIVETYQTSLGRQAGAV